MTKSTRKPIILVGIAFVGLVCSWLLYKLLSTILVILVLLIAGAAAAKPIAAPQAFPNAEIVYRGGNGLGFINADGSGQESFRFRAPGRSLLSEGTELYLMTGDHNALITV